MDLATFIANTKKYLWRPDDTELEAELPNLIRTAENRMFKDLKMTDEEKVLGIAVTTWPAVDLPVDCDLVTSLTFDKYGPGTYTSPRDYNRAKERYPLVPGNIRISSTAVNQTLYTIQERKIYHRFDAASVEAPVDITLVYNTRPVSLTDDDDTFFNEFRAMYEAAVHYEACDWLLELQRAQQFDAKYLNRKEEALLDQQRRKFMGSPLKMQMPRRDVC